MASEPEPAAQSQIEPVPSPKRRLPLLWIVLAVVVIAGGAGAWILLAAPNRPPAAAFTARLKDLRVIVDAGNSSDPEGAIASYSWDWGDGGTGQGREASHTYADEGTFPVTLTVTDARGAPASTSESVTITALPVPHFIARHNRFTVAFNATDSFHPLGRAIVSYEWDFGDGANASGPVVEHVYAGPGRRTVSLEVTDSLGRSATASRYVSPASTTVDIVTDRYFEAGCPYKDYWNARYNTYGDQLLLNSVPCTDYYPWVLFSADVEFQAINPSYVYTLYRWDAKVRNHGGYNLSEPVMVPVADYGAPVDPNGYIEFDLSFEYLDSVLANQLRTTPFSVNRKYYADGFGYVLRGTYTMDFTSSKRVFGVGDNAVFSPTLNLTSQWTASRNAFGSDNLYAASQTNGNVSEYRGFPIPQLPASPILKVEVGLEGRTSGDDDVRIAFSTDSGATWEVAGSVDLGTSDGTTFFDVTALRMWSPSLLNSTNFRTRIEHVQVGGAPELTYVDWVPVRVTADARFWWAANTNVASPRSPGPAQTAFQSWLERMGNGKYDIYSGFEWFYEVDFAWLNATVEDDGTTSVQVFSAGWGWDVLQARWFYWGNASYQQAVCQQGFDTESVSPPIPCTTTLPYGAIRPAGWSPMETCWCEHGTIKGRITNALDLDFVAYQGYHFEAWANVGADGLARTADDLPSWVFQPYLMDYVPHSASGSNGASGFPNSELRWYVGRQNVHLAPGSYAYGVSSEFLVAPHRWPLPEGSSLTLVMPRFEVPWYDPVRSVWNPTEKIGDYVTFLSHLELRLIRPAGNYFLYDPRANVVSIAGPHSWGVADSVLPLEGYPFIEFGPEARA